MVLARLVEKYPELAECVPDIERAYAAWSASYHRGCKTLVCGNGGSAADSEHIAAELMKGMLAQRPLPPSEQAHLRELFGEQGELLASRLQGALPTISLVSHTSLLTAFANDVAADMAFAQQVYAYGKEGDVLLALSTSGASTNILHALRVARARGLTTLGLTGGSGGEMRTLCDVLIQVPCSDTVDIQERHMPIYHALCIMLEQEFFGE